MNYVERHFGDWARDTAHLSMLEDGAYNRLCDLYYVREVPLPADLPSCCRLVRALSKQERDAVKSVLGEFFHLTDEGWRHKRCDVEIERFRTKSGKAAASARARWEKASSHSEGNANANATASTDAMRTHSEGNATRERGRARSHSPLPNTQELPHTPNGGKTSAVSLKTWLDECRQKGERPIPDVDPVFAYAEEVGIPREFLSLAWSEFKHRYGQPDAKRYRDWRAVFRKAVRGNWLKLWYADGQAYLLTTVGVQAQRSHGEKAA